MDKPARRLLISVDTSENNDQGAQGYSINGQGQTRIISRSTDSHRNVTQGFYVTASVTGNIVHLAISTNRDRMSQERQDVVNVQSTDTTVSGPLGEWITLAGVNGQSQADRQALTRSYSTSSRNDMTFIRPKM